MPDARHWCDDPVAEAHSRELAERIRAEAEAAGGSLPFDRFMELALYAPGLGYYMAGARKLGADGDFVTAPELSPLFGRCLARQCQEALAAVGGGDILEVGAGQGTLAAQVLGQLDRDGPLPRRYRILELSPELADRQRTRLRAAVPHLMPRIDWVTGFPEGLRGVVVANEVLDAMPVHRFEILADGSVGEVMVTPTPDGLGWQESVVPARSPGLAAAVAEIQADGWARSAGVCGEVNLRLAPWLASLSAALDRALILLIDYGYPRSELYHPERRAGTLMCHHRHQAHGDPYRAIGLQDITAHVDFTAVARAAARAELALAGYSTQTHFLLGCGLDRLLAEAPEDPLALAQGAKQLVLPTAMGERFQVMGLTKGLEYPWRGFALRDLRGRL
ncbi:SAM-dependent methyltransferase [Thioalkalicoccus limnaeus]|uniref:SAM-dependent methyltransferase n=1 Tax=Thioalkalicoccus limnaeus TaxID=120681 RepID=A0ABV4B9Z1_9GAMM